QPGGGLGGTRRRRDRDRGRRGGGGRRRGGCRRLGAGQAEGEGGHRGEGGEHAWGTELHGNGNSCGNRLAAGRKGRTKGRIVAPAQSRTGCGVPNPRPAMRSASSAGSPAAGTRRRHRVRPPLTTSSGRASLMPAASNRSRARRALSALEKLATCSRVDAAAAGAAGVAAAGAAAAGGGSGGSACTSWSRAVAG